MQVTLGERGTSGFSEKTGGTTWVEVMPIRDTALAAGEQVVVSGLARLSDGATVRVRGSR
jgi:hypothetical protein